jgi:hypothetical protein
LAISFSRLSIRASVSDRAVAMGFARLWWELVWIFALIEVLKLKNLHANSSSNICFLQHQNLVLKPLNVSMIVEFLSLKRKV